MYPRGIGTATMLMSLHRRLVTVVHRLGRKHAGGKERPSATAERKCYWCGQYDSQSS